MGHMTRQAKLNALRRRRDYLAQQIEQRSFDKQPRFYEKREVEALDWAIETLGALVELHRAREANTTEEVKE